MRPALLLAVVALAAGCGDDGAEQQEPQPVPAATAELAERCGFGAPQAGASAAGLVPEGLLPGDAAAIRSDAGRAIVLLRGAINDAYRALLANAQQRGLQIVFQEVETLDAELEVATGDGVSRLVLTTARGCADVTRAVVTRRPA